MNDEKSLIPFNFDSDSPIRAALGDKDDPWFVGGDACKALGIQNVTQALNRLDEDERKTVYVSERGQAISDTYTTYSSEANKPITLISESGLYSLILTSRRPEAKRFKKWITAEVLPAIRKAGQYTAQAMTPLQQLRATVETLEAQQIQLDNHENRIERIEARQDAIQSGSEYFSIVAYCKLKHLPAPTLTEAAAHGRRATALSRQRGYTVGKVNDPRFGEVNTYHLAVLDELFGGERTS